MGDIFFAYALVVSSSTNLHNVSLGGVGKHLSSAKINLLSTPSLVETFHSNCAGVVDVFNSRTMYCRNQERLLISRGSWNVCSFGSQQHYQHPFFDASTPAARVASLTSTRTRTAEFKCLESANVSKGPRRSCCRYRRNHTSSHDSVCMSQLYMTNIVTGTVTQVNAIYAAD